jgi:membrane-associated phospholipid phosphatase
VIQTGRELARWFEAETPGLDQRQALNYLLPQMGWPPSRQARVWAALDVALYGALLAAWHFKWTDSRTSMRPRPIEVSQQISVLYNFQVNATGSADGDLRKAPQPSPGTPRHPAYPAGHSTVAGAGNTVLAYFFPDFTADFEDLADNAGMARLWAGIHYRSDHLFGLVLGRVVANLVIDQLRRDGVDAQR